MLEALVAIGLAGNVVQFAQVAAGLDSQADDIRKNGAPSSLRDIRKLIVYLIDQTKAFHIQLGKGLRRSCLLRKTRQVQRSLKKRDSS